MKKFVSGLIVCAMLFTCLLNSPALAASGGAEEDSNVALQAKASTTSVTGQNDILNIIDGNDTFGWATGNHELPQDIVLDWGNKKVRTSKLTLLTNYGPGQGITKMDIEYFDGMKWQTARSDVAIDWKMNEQTAEAVDIVIPEIEAAKIRLHIKEANLVWEGFAIIELKVWGVLLWTSEAAAQAIVSLEQPARGQTQLKLPVHDGFDIRIHSTDQEERISLDGTISPRQDAATVTLILEVVSRADQSRALTSPLQVTVPGVPPAEYALFAPVEDKTGIIKNPAMGWAMYVEEFSGPLIDADTYWQAVDPYRDAASILYIRVPWSRMEPAEGAYAWNVDENYKKLVDMALERKLKLAFRIVVDSQDVHMQATPQFVFDAGAEGVAAASNPNFKTPYVTDPVFRQKFENFVAAFAKQYDNPDVVDYIDGGSLGWWGEMYTFNQKMSAEEKEDTFKWISNLYAGEFKHVLLGMQYGNSFELRLQDWALDEQGFMIRRDSYGSPVYFPRAAQDLINTHWPKVPVFAENCYQSFVSWPESCDGNTRPIHDMLARVVDDALYTHANTLDLRHPEDVKEWVTNHPDLVEQFALQGGYRLVLDDVAYPAAMLSGQSYPLYHSWKNAAAGKLPNDVPNWGHKYKVAFALLDRMTGSPVYMSIDEAEPADWIKGQNYNYTGKLDLNGIPGGTYELAVAIVDSSKQNKPAIRLAVKDIMTEDGWYKLGAIRVVPALGQLDKIVTSGWQEGLIKNNGIASSLLAKISSAQKAEPKQAVKKLNGLTEFIMTHSGKHIDSSFANLLVSDIAFLLQAQAFQQSQQDS
ncbi:discoidin domain-containing protein [Paenibacillus sp. GCM10027626]|uniref:discoidin domain-containing protein n=1 Tax=Paenibacillus sp. GCM10027626 TaxID=3273411 RepID=UPI003636ACD2